MARTKNRVELIGHVGQNPNIHYTGNGAIVANFSLATSEPYKDAKGEWAERPEWHSLVTFKRNAEIVRDHVKQGARLRVEGRLQTRSWTDRESNKKVYKTEIVVNEIMFLSSREESTTQPQKTASGYESPATTSHTGQPDEPPYTDAEVAQYQDTEEIPF